MPGSFSLRCSPGRSRLPRIGPILALWLVLLAGNVAGEEHVSGIRSGSCGMRRRRCAATHRPRARPCARPWCSSRATGARARRWGWRTTCWAVSRMRRRSIATGSRPSPAAPRRCTLGGVLRRGRAGARHRRLRGAGVRRLSPQLRRQARSCDYRAPELSRRPRAAWARRVRALHVADAGCGTGLCGPLLRAVCAAGWRGRPVGGMLRRAKARGLYDVLHKAELMPSCEGAAPASYDAIVSADTLCYFGELRAVRCGGAHGSAAGGWLVFHGRVLRRGQSRSRRGLPPSSPHGRYSHRQSYLRACSPKRAWSVDGHARPRSCGSRRPGRWTAGSSRHIV